MDLFKKLKILIIEPYFGLSHKTFLEGIRKLPFSFHLMTLPARKWKWRMRLSAPYFADQLFDLGKKFDRILCSTFLDVAAFRALAPKWQNSVPLLTYFHENQFEYPVQMDDARDMHFAVTNLTTALASDKVAFNSMYNKESFLRGIRKLIKKSPDMKFKKIIEEIKSKTKVIYPGIDFTTIDNTVAKKKEKVPTIIWNHRWEHDKNPELFFNTLFELDSEGIDFRVIVLGESFDRKPKIFETAKKKLAKNILHFGFADSKKDYAKWLKQGDIIVSTSLHEFFGMSVIEGIRAGNYPVLPERLSYPELFPDKFLYKSDRNFKDKLKKEILSGGKIKPGIAEKLTSPFSWEKTKLEYRDWLEDPG